MVRVDVYDTIKSKEKVSMRLLSSTHKNEKEHMECPNKYLDLTINFFLGIHAILQNV